MWPKLRHENYFDTIPGKSTWSTLLHVNMKVLFMWPLALFTVTTQWEPVGLITNLCMNGCSSHNLEPFLLHKGSSDNFRMVTVAFCQPQEHVQAHGTLWKENNPFLKRNCLVHVFSSKIPLRLQSPFLWWAPSPGPCRKQH